MKAHIGVDAKTGLTHSFTTTAANEHDLNQAEHLLHGEEKFIFANSGYRGAENREALEGVKADWHVADHQVSVRLTKARYHGLMKNDGKLAMLFALANLVRVDQMLRT